MQPAVPSPRWSKDQSALSTTAAATTTASVHHVITVDSTFLLSQPTLTPFANTALPPPLLVSLPPSTLRVYSRFHIKSVLALMGVKPRHIHRIVAHAFSQLTQLLLPPSSESATLGFTVPLLAGDTSFSHSSTVCLSSTAWLTLIRSSLTLSKHYTPSDTPALFAICHSIVVSRQQHVLILLAGTSGTGKSTLASLLADRMRLSCVVGTDSVRHILRQRVKVEACRVLHVSTYQAHQCVADDADITLLSSPYQQPPVGQQPPSSPSASSASTVGSSLSQAQRVKLGHHQQSLHVCAHLHSLIASLIASRTSAIIEGAHLLPSFLAYLLATLSSPTTLLLPFLIYISNETKHRERFALRSHPTAVNPYILHFPAIRTIQKHVLGSAECMGGEQWLPTIDNTNMDRSVAAVHEIVSRVMVREGRLPTATADSSSGSVSGCGGSMEWSGEGRVDVLREVDEMRAGAWSSKAMQRVIRMKVEKRHLFDRLREAQWQRREEEDEEAEAEGGVKDGADESKDVSGASAYNVAGPRSIDGASTVISAAQPAITVPQSHTSSLSSYLFPSLPSLPFKAPQPLADAHTTLSQPSRAPSSILRSPSSSPRLPSSIPIRSPPPASSSSSARPRASPLSPNLTASPNLSPHLSSLPPPFLHHYHQRTGRLPSSSDDDEYDVKRGGGGGGTVSESEHSVSVTYSHDVPSLLAPSADDDGDGDGSDEEGGEQEEGEDGYGRGIVAIPESDDHVEDGVDAEGGESDSASDGCYERAVTDDEDRQLVERSPVSKDSTANAEIGDSDGVVNSVVVVSRGGNGSSDGSSSNNNNNGSNTRQEIVLY